MPTLGLHIQTETDGEWTYADGPLYVTVDGPITTVTLTSRAIIAARFWRDHTGHPGNVCAQLIDERAGAANGYALTLELPDDPHVHAAFIAAQGDGVYVAADPLESTRGHQLVERGLLADVGSSRLAGGWCRRFALVGPYEADYAIHRRTGDGPWVLAGQGRRRLTDGTFDAVEALAENMTMWHSAAGSHDVRVTVVLLADDGVVEASAVRRLTAVG